MEIRELAERHLISKQVAGGQAFAREICHAVGRATVVAARVDANDIATTRAALPAVVSVGRARAGMRR